MPPTVLVLPLIAEQQVSFHHCGPASIRMIISYYGLAAPQGTLWSEVQENSAGPLTPPHPSPLFTKQVCYNCGTWFCWLTSPEAMAITIRNYALQYTSAVATYPPTRDEAVSAQIRSLDRAVRFAPATTIRAANHWVVVNGYHRDDPAYPGAPPVPIGEYMVNGMYYINPFEGPTPLVQFVAAAQWKSMLRPQDCGSQQNNYPTVVGGPRLFLMSRWLLKVILLLRRYWWPPRRV
jgi:hypothetical protein